MVFLLLSALPAILDALIRFIIANVPPFRTRWDVEEMPDLTGRVALVTGGNTGIGYATCLQLARRGAKVYIACRTESRAQSAIQKIKQFVPNSQVGYIHFDLTILSSAKAAADEFIRKETRLDMLINNAGVMGVPYALSPDGIDVTACNATGHFALTNYLLPILKQTSLIPNSHVRIVNVSSSAHLNALEPKLFNLTGLNRPGDRPMDRYSYSKLNNMLLTNELQKRLLDTSIHCLSVHPGVVASELTRGITEKYPFTEVLVDFSKRFMATSDEGAITQLYAATSPDIERKGLRAAYLVPYGQVGKKTPTAEDKDGKFGRQFWDLCESLVKAAEEKSK